MTVRPMGANVSTLSIFVDVFDGINAAGRLYSHHLEKEYTFRGLEQVLFIGEMIFDTLSFPQASFSRRAFSKKTQKTMDKRVEAMQNKNVNETANPKEGDKASFLVKVLFRQNATWQGTVTWVEENKSQNFRSTLELIRLMEEAMGTPDIDWAD